LGYPWLEEFNPKINWGEGKLTGTSVHLKTPNVVAREQLKNHIRQMEVDEIQKTTVAQQMAEKLSYHPNIKSMQKSSLKRKPSGSPQVESGTTGSL